MAKRAAPGKYEAARELRLAGRSFKAIAAEIGVSVGSVHRWTRDIVLAVEQRKRLTQGQVAASAAGRRRARARRNQLIRQAGRERCRCDVAFLVVCCLYWGEGSKLRRTAAGGNRFRFTNSDPAMIELVAKWLTSEGRLADIQVAIYYHDDTPHADYQIREWWSGRLGVPLSQFRGSYVKSSASSKPVHRGKLPYGVCRLSLAKSTELLQLVTGGIEFVAQSGALTVLGCGGSIPISEVDGPGSTPGGTISCH